MKKRILSAALCLCLILSLVPGMALGAEGDAGPEAAYQTVSGGTWSFGTLQEACDNVYSGGGVLLMRDVQLERGVTVTKPMTITSNGDACYTIAYSSQVRGDYLLTAKAGGSKRVTLTNIILDGGSQQGHTSQNELVGVQSGQFAMVSGAVLQNNDTANASDSAGGLRLMGGTAFIVTGSAIRNCRGIRGGGAAVVGQGAALVVNGGVIEDCEAFCGGGVFLYHNSAPSSSLYCRLYMQDGGIIRNNRAVKTMEGIDHPGPSERGCGGGVYLEGGVINMPFQNIGGTVEGNYAEWEGGGIYTQNGTLNLYSGAVTGNRSERHGGGIVVMSPTVTAVLGGPITITGNTSNVSYSDNLFLDTREDTGTEGDPTNPAWIIMPLTGRIGISRKVLPDEAQSYRVVAVSSPTPGPYGMHTITESDLDKFYSDDPKYVTLMHSNPEDPTDPDIGSIVITNADVAFDNQNHGERPPSQLINAQHKVDEPAPLEEPGYTFEGWYTTPNWEEGDKWVFTEDEVHTDEKPQYLYARWDLIQYDIEYVLHDGLNDPGNPSSYNIESPSITLKDPIKVGCNFIGWQEITEASGASLLAAEPEEAISAGIPHGSIGKRKFEALWEEAAPCKVTYVDGVDGAVFAPDEHTDVPRWSPIPPFRDGTPTRAGYTFTGWLPSVELPIPDRVSENVVYTAQWNLIEYNITYELDGGINDVENPTAYNVETPDITLQPPTKENHTFLGWTWPGEDTPQLSVTIPKGSTGDRTYTAHWKLNSYPVVFDVQGHGTAPADQDVPHGGKAAQPNAPTASGWIFGGWYREPECETPWSFETDPVTGPVTLYAKWSRRSTSTSQSKPSKPDPEEKPPYTPPSLESEDHFAYIVGYPDGTVQPEAYITRAEAATIFFRLMTEDFRAENWAETNPFPDVERESWYNNAASTGLKAGLIRGLPDGTFGGGRPITRGEFAAMAARFLSDDTAPDSGFPDLAGHWAKDEVDRAVAAGWLKGYPDGGFHPDDYITRAQVMTLVNRMLGRVPDLSGMREDMTLWPDNPADAWYYADVQEATNGHTYERDGESGPETWTGLTENRDWTRLER